MGVVDLQASECGHGVRLDKDGGRWALDVIKSMGIHVLVRTDVGEGCSRARVWWYGGETLQQMRLKEVGKGWSQTARYSRSPAIWIVVLFGTAGVVYSRSELGEYEIWGEILRD